MANVLYALHDSDPAIREREGARTIRPAQAQSFQKKGYGIFHSVNEFTGGRRTTHLEKLRYFYVDLDKGSKRSMVRLIEEGLIPTRVVESKNGFHIYWQVRGKVSVEDYKEILKRLIWHYKGDKNAADVTRILRTPGYYHLKDPSSPFLVRIVFEASAADPISYGVSQMRYWFEPVPEKPQPHQIHKPRTQDVKASDDFWERVYNFDCREALKRFSGKPFVNGEVYDFYQVPSGNLNIKVNGKTTSCFIDQNGRIGSSDGGGPSFWQWLHWYGLSHKEINDIARQEIPELWVK